MALKISNNGIDLALFRGRKSIIFILIENSLYLNHLSQPSNLIDNLKGETKGYEKRE